MSRAVGLSPVQSPAPAESWLSQGSSLVLCPLFSETRDFNSSFSKFPMPMGSCKAFLDHLVIATQERDSYRSDIQRGKVAKGGRMEHMKNTGKISMQSQPACTQGSGLWALDRKLHQGHSCLQPDRSGFMHVCVLLYSVGFFFFALFFSLY